MNNKKRDRIENDKSGQVTLFIILAIIIVVVILIVVYFGMNFFKNSVPKELSPVYSYYQSCVESSVSNGAKMLGQSAGHIDPDKIKFSPGSEYMPFSSHLAFLGNSVPYWFYVSGNGIVYENIPTKEKMEIELNEFVISQMKYCDFSNLIKQGYGINLSNAKVETTINLNNIHVKFDQKIDVSYGDKSYSSNGFDFEVKSLLGKFYDLALKIYKKQSQDLFLENYGVDVLRLYAPVDGTQISCSPKVWNIREIKKNLTNSLIGNIQAIKINGDYFELKDKDNKYFIQDIGEKTQFHVNFMFDSKWPMKLESWPSEDGIMRADPVGIQEGMGILGFCYIPYHFVYDFDFPVMVQIYSNGEMFQFPVVVIIDKNKPRKAMNDSESVSGVIPELCNHPMTDMKVYTYNTKLEAVNAQIKFKCFDTSCPIGESVNVNGDSVLNAKFPQCVNGYIIASSEGYETVNYLVSTLNSNSVNIAMNKLYKINVKIDPMNEDDYAFISFNYENKTKTISYPQQKEVELSPGDYKIKVYIYSNSSVNLKGSKSQKCVDIPKGGISGMFGLTEQKCFDLSIPDQNVEYGVSGGGVQNQYIAESVLENSKTIVISPVRYGVPNSVDSLQKNYNSIEISKLNIHFE